MNGGEHALRLPRRVLLGRLLRFLRPLYGMMAFSVVMRVCNLLAATALIALAASVVSRYLADRGVLWTWVGYLSAAAGAMGVFHYLEQWSGHYVAFRLLSMLRNAFYEKLEPLAPAGTQSLQSGDAVARVINDVELIEPFYAHTIAPVIAALVVPGLLLGYVWTVHPRFVWSLAPPFALMVFVAPALVDWLGRRHSRAARRAFGEVNAHLTDSLQGLRDSLAFGYGERRRAELLARGRKLERAKRGLVRADAAQRALMELAIAGSALAVLWVGVDLVQAGELDALRDLPPVLAVAVTGFAAVTGLTNVMNDFNTSMICADRLYELMDQAPVVRETGSAGVEGLAPSLRFEDVCFRYGSRRAPAEVDADAEPVLREVSFEVGAGRHVAIVGASGAGKSTLVSLLLRFWEPQSGVIRLGGRDIRELASDSLREAIAVVSQRTFLFNTTIADNILLAKPDASPDELRRVSRLANLEAFIESLPQGYDTQVGELGSRLSGGQRQRIAIARALLKDAPILVLDEATSSLDVENERQVNAAIARLMEGRTCVTIAHRLSSVAGADEIVVLDKGRVAERGRHAELLARGGVYTRLFRLQRDELASASTAGP